MVDVVGFLNEKRFTVLFSGGKDSLCALLWVLDNIHHEKWDVLYVEVSGNSHPLCTEYVREVCDELGVSDKLKICRRDRRFSFDPFNSACSNCAAGPLSFFYMFILKTLRSRWKRTTQLVYMIVLVLWSWC